MALCLGLLFVKHGYYDTVEFVFLVTGYTKNPCDCIFNLLEQVHHIPNIYTFNEMKKILDKNENINVVAFSSLGIFKIKGILALPELGMGILDAA